MFPRFEAMGKENANSFSLPAYFLYITRAFATLEGIGLSIDEEFSIVKECWPYLV
jgi:predicted unusual protein kinase regulating ubiquinone biosynthesis (AarF/ABC1/UbiB family)